MRQQRQRPTSAKCVKANADIKPTHGKKKDRVSLESASQLADSSRFITRRHRRRVTRFKHWQPLLHIFFGLATEFYVNMTTLSCCRSGFRKRRRKKRECAVEQLGEKASRQLRQRDRARRLAGPSGSGNGGGGAVAGNSFTLVSSLMRPLAFRPLMFVPRKSSITSLLTSSLLCVPALVSISRKQQESPSGNVNRLSVSGRPARWDLPFNK